MGVKTTQALEMEITEGHSLKSEDRAYDASIPIAVQAQERKRRKRRIMKIAVYFMFGIISVGVFAIWLFHKDPVEYLRFGSEFILTVKLRSMEVRNADGDSIVYAEVGRQLLAAPYDRCWTDHFDDYEPNCLYWRKSARLRVSQHTNVSNAYCYNMKWEGLKVGFEAEDCFYLQYHQWYGYLSREKPSWPIGNTRMYYRDYYPAYPQSQTENLIPIWFGSQSVAIFVHSKYPFSISWNVSDKKQFCIKSKNSPKENGRPTILLEYTVCQGNSLPDIYNIAHKHMLTTDSSSPSFPSSTSSSSYSHTRTNSNTVDLYPAKMSNTVDLYPQKPVCVLTPNDTIPLNGSECGFLELFEGWEREIGDLSINPNLTDRVNAIMKTADAHSSHFTFPVSPFFSYKSQHFQQGVEHGYFVQDSLKLATRMLIWRGLEGAALDVTNPNATSWFLSIINKLISDYNVKAIKLLHVDVPLDSSVHDGSVTYLEYNQIFYQRLSASLGVSLILEMASGFIAEPVYTPVKMSFERYSGRSCLYRAIPDSLIMGMSGFPLLIAELDATNLQQQQKQQQQQQPPAQQQQAAAVSEEILLRWLQLAIFYPVLKIPNYIPLMKSPRIEKYLSDVLELRNDELLPYLKTVWKQQPNTPIIRPLWWSVANKKPVLDTNDQFMVGDRLLVAPVLCEGMDARSVYLPEGTWVRKGMKPVKGPQTVRLTIDSFNVIPYFWREDK